MKPLPTSDSNEVRFLRKPEARAALPMSTLRGGDWAKEAMGGFRVHHHSTALEWYMERQLHGINTLSKIVDMHPDVMGGLPVLAGTRFTVAQVFAELSETNGVDEVANNYNIDANIIRCLLDGMSLCMQKPYKVK